MEKVDCNPKNSMQKCELLIYKANDFPVKGKITKRSYNDRNQTVSIHFSAFPKLFFTTEKNQR